MPSLEMPVQLFQIFLDKVKEPYTAGEKVTGKFIIVVSDSYAHNGIYLKFEGHAIIKWTEDSSCFEHTVAKQHRARKQFFDTLFKYASEEVLGDGTHIFPFEYNLPSNLPSSLSTPTITIWYKMEALIHKDPKPRREVLVFPVKGQLNLNSLVQVEDLRIPLSEVKSRSMMAFYPPCFCSLHYTSVGVRVEQRGFVKGDTVKVNLAVMNDHHFTFVSLCLIQELTVVTKDKTMIERRTIAKLTLPDLTPEDTDDYRRWEESLQIPKDTVVSSNAAEYPDIKINYFIKFSAEATKFPYKLIKILIPITIGSTSLIHIQPVATPEPEDEKDPEDKEEPGSSCQNEVIKLEQTVPIKEEVVTIVVTHQEDEKEDGDDDHLIVDLSPPKIVFDHDPPSSFPPPPPQEEEIFLIQDEQSNYPSLTDSFFLSLEDSMVHVTPTKEVPKSKGLLLSPKSISSSRVACSSSTLSPGQAFLIDGPVMRYSSGDVSSKKSSDNSTVDIPTGFIQSTSL